MKTLLFHCLPFQVTFSQVVEAGEATKSCDGLVLGGAPIRVDVLRRIHKEEDKRKKIVPIVWDLGPGAVRGGGGGGRDQLRVKLDREMDEYQAKRKQQVKKGAQ